MAERQDPFWERRDSLRCTHTKPIRAPSIARKSYELDKTTDWPPIDVQIQAWGSKVLASGPMPP